jgi:hypothetical protein
MIDGFITGGPEETGKKEKNIGERREGPEG